MLAVEPEPTSEELAAIVAALERVAPAATEPPPKPSRWRAASRVYDDPWDAPR